MDTKHRNFKEILYSVSIFKIAMLRELKKIKKGVMRITSLNERWYRKTIKNNGKTEYFKIKLSVPPEAKRMPLLFWLYEDFDVV